jgi:hypothetical protein
LTDANLKESNKDFNNRSKFVMNWLNLEKWHFRFRKYNNGISVVLILSFMLLLFPSSYWSLKIDNAWATTTTAVGGTTIPVYMVTTRDGSDPPQGVPGTGYDGNLLGDINQLRSDCPSEIAIFVHGWHNDDNKAKERLDRVRMSLVENNYAIPLVGFSWPSDKEWEDAKVIAKQDGPKLAHFIVDYVYNCKYQYSKDVNVRLISHSLGARVILSALDELHNNLTWTNEGFKILSVHLMGAAVDNEEVSKNPSDITEDITNDPTIKSAYGEPIQEEVIRFYNLYNPQDNMLQQDPFPPYPGEVYPFFEQDLALGQAGRQQQRIEEIDMVSTPPYYEINILNEIEHGRDADGIEDEHFVFCFAGICDRIVIEGWDFGLCLAHNYFGMLVTDCRIGTGDNHGGYMGFRDNPANRDVEEYDGAMDVVVQHWLAPLN